MHHSLGEAVNGPWETGTELMDRSDERLAIEYLTELQPTLLWVPSKQSTDNHQDLTTDVASMGARCEAQENRALGEKGEVRRPIIILANSQ